MERKERGIYQRRCAFSVGEDVESPFVDDIFEKLQFPAASVEDNGDASFRKECSDLREDLGHHLRESFVGFGGNDKERVARGVIDPVIGGGGHGDANARNMCFGNIALAVIGSDMSIDIKKTHYG